MRLVLVLNTVKRRSFKHSTWALQFKWIKEKPYFDGKHKKKDVLSHEGGTREEDNGF
jgi:hypothetical protein